MDVNENVSVQGHYALDAAIVAKYPTPDITIDRIGNILDLSTDELTCAK